MEMVRDALQLVESFGVTTLDQAKVKQLQNVCAKLGVARYGARTCVMLLHHPAHACHVTSMLTSAFCNIPWLPAMWPVMSLHALFLLIRMHAVAKSVSVCQLAKSVTVYQQKFTANCTGAKADILKRLYEAFEIEDAPVKDAAAIRASLDAAQVGFTDAPVRQRQCPGSPHAH